MFCHRTQEFLAEQGIEFENRDITKDPQAFEELKRLGYAATPVTVINGEIIIGFDQPKLKRLLGIDEKPPLHLEEAIGGLCPFETDAPMSIN